jgi:MFS family permease
LSKGQLAFERAQEEYANRQLLTTEGLLTALIAPLLGWLLDQWGVDGMLMASSIFLFAFLVLSLAVIGLLRVIQSRKSQSKSNPTGVGEGKGDGSVAQWGGVLRSREDGEDDLSVLAQPHTINIPTGRRLSAHF